MAFRRTQVYHLHNTLDFLNGQHVREMHPDFGGIQQFCGVVFALLGVDEVAIEGPHSGDYPRLRPGVEVRFVQVFQKLLQVLEGGRFNLVFTQKVRQKQYIMQIGLHTFGREAFFVH